MVDAETLALQTANASLVQSSKDVVAGFRGISFPFRVGIKGGAVMTSTSRDDITHIEESIIQLLGTRKGERWMEYHIYADLDIFVFEPNDQSLHTLIDYQVRECLKLENRIEVTQVDIKSDENYLWINIKYLVIAYQVIYQQKIKFSRETGYLVNNYSMLMHDSNNLG